MGIINIYTVKNALEEEGWSLLSDSYKNLQTPLLMRCPLGHEQEQTFDYWRKHKLCDKCLGGTKQKVKKNKIPKKGINVQRVLALDAATSVTGYSVYDNKILVGYGTFKTDAGLTATERINQVKQWLILMIQELEPNFIGVENIQLQKYGAQTPVKTFQVLANLQGVILDTIFEACIDSDTVYPSEWRAACGISSGDQHRNARKKAAQNKVKLWYDADCSEDEADAICIGKYFINRLKSTWGED